MAKENPPPERRTFYPAIFLTAGLLVFILAFRTLAPILLSFILILLVSLAANPLVLKLRRLSGGRTLATGMIVLAFLALVGLAGWAFYNPIQRSTAKFIDQLPQYWERIQRPILKWEQRAVLSEQRIKQEVSSEVARENSGKTNAPTLSLARTNPAPATPSSPSTNRAHSPLPSSAPPAEPSSAGGLLESGAGALLGGVSGSFKNAASTLASMGFVVVTVFFGVIFTLLKPKPILRAGFGMIPQDHHARAMTVTRRIADFVPRWAMATLSGMAIIGVMIFFATWPIFGFQDALVLGLIALVFEAVPYLGPILAAVPALLLAASEGGLTPLWVIIAYLAVQALENNLIMPVVVGGQLQLHPVAVIFSMLICVTIFGVLGVLIAMPAVAVLTILHEEIYRPRYLPGVTNDDLEREAQEVLEKKHSGKKVEPSGEKKSRAA